MAAAITLPRLKMCKDCSELAIATDGRCRTHTRSSRHMSAYSARPMPSKSMKNPIGMELECVVDAYALRSHVCVVAPYVCPDASLGDNGLEIKAVADAKKIGDKGADLAQRAHLAGGKVNNRCGFHVHLSNPMETYSSPYHSIVRSNFRALTYQDMINLFPYVRGMENYFFSIMPPHRRDSTYCRSIEYVDDLKRHYSWLSISERVPTLEVRLHPGTLNPWKVKAWAEVCVGLQSILHSVIMGAATAEAELAKIGRFQDTFPTTSLAYKYLKARQDNNGVLTKFGFR